MDKETREFLDRKFNAIDDRFNKIDDKFNKIDDKFEDAKRHADQKIEENKRYFGVVAEGLRNEIRQVAEGVLGLNEKLDREMTSLREENEEAHREILSAIKFSYAELDQRIRVLEGNFQTLKSRLDRLEAGRN